MPDQRPCDPDFNDRTSLRSGRLLDIVPCGMGNSWEGRFLKQHYQLTTDAFRRAGVPITDLHRLLLNRLGRVGLEIARLECRLDGETNPDPAAIRRYHNLSGSYLHVLREIVLRPPRRVWSPERHELPDDDLGEPPNDLRNIMAEMTEMNSEPVG